MRTFGQEFASEGQGPSTGRLSLEDLRPGPSSTDPLLPLASIVTDGRLSVRDHAMASACLERNHIVQTLQGLMERLTNPDLTIAEANELRPRLACLLEAIDGVSFNEADERRC